MQYYAIGDTGFTISHHGILGMHWGIRRFQPYGKGGYDRKGGKTGKEIGEAKQISSKIRRNATTFDTVNGGKALSWNQDNVKTMEEVQKLHEKLSSARNEYRQAMALAEEYNNLPEKEQDKYIRMASDAAWERWASPEELKTQEQRENYFNWYKYEDGDQGSDNSFSFYCKAKGTSYDEQEAIAIAAQKKYEKACADEASHLLKEYGETPIASHVNYKGEYVTETVKDATVAALNNLAFDEQFKKNYYMPT